MTGYASKESAVEALNEGAHDYLEKPLGHKSHRLLHTSYADRKRLVKHTMKEIWQEIEERT